MKPGLPNLIIAGVNKAGTTSLYFYLSGHPDICTSNVKETFYFMGVKWGEPLKPIEDYAKYFDHWSDEKYIVESTPRYIHGGAPLANKIKETLGDVKILMILREPNARLFSFFKFKKRSLDLNKDLLFKDYVAKCTELPAKEKFLENNRVYFGVEDGFYSKYIEDWFNVFGNSMKIVFFDDLKTDPQLVMKDIADWLSIEGEIFKTMPLKPENRSIDYKNKMLHKMSIKTYRFAEKFWISNPGIRRVAKGIYYAINGAPYREEMDPETVAYLNSIYEPYNQRLSEILKDRGYSKLPDWLTKP